jgi:putative transposase
MDGKGCWRDNIFIERLWKTIKYEEVYLYAYDSVSEARQALCRYITFYNTRCPHSSLDGKTPDTVRTGKQNGKVLPEIRGRST